MLITEYDDTDRDDDGNPINRKGKRKREINKKVSCIRYTSILSIVGVQGIKCLAGTSLSQGTIMRACWIW